MWGFYQLKLGSDTSGPAFRERSTHEGKRTRGCPSPRLHVRQGPPGHRHPEDVLRARRSGRAEQADRADPVACRAVLAAPAESRVDPVARAVPVVPVVPVVPEDPAGPAPAAAARVVQEDLADPVALEVRGDLAGLAAVPADPVLTAPVPVARRRVVALRPRPAWPRLRVSGPAAST